MAVLWYAVKALRQLKLAKIQLNTVHALRRGCLLALNNLILLNL
jgi:hypothetical protein